MLIRSAVKRCVVALLLCGILAALADDPVDAAVKRLSSVGIFAFGPVGYAGSISKGELDFKFLLSQPQPVAIAAFEKLYRTGNPQGKSYALSGIQKLNPNRFKELLASGTISTDEVEVESGCMVSHELLRDIVKQIDRGKFRQ